MTAQSPLNFKIQWFDDYHDIPHEERLYRKVDDTIRVKEINTDSLGFEYVRESGFLYPGLVYEHGQQPSIEQVKELFRTVAEKYGFKESNSL